MRIRYSLTELLTNPRLVLGAWSLSHLLSTIYYLRALPSSPTYCTPLHLDRLTDDLPLLMKSNTPLHRTSRPLPVPTTAASKVINNLLCEVQVFNIAP